MLCSKRERERERERESRAEMGGFGSELMRRNEKEAEHKRWKGACERGALSRFLGLFYFCFRGYSGL